MSVQRAFIAKRMRTADDEARAPKYAHLERERRWLVDTQCSPSLHLVDPIEINDRYILGTRMRLRRMRGLDGKTVYKLTKKYTCEDPLARPIVTAYLTADENAVLASLPALTVEKVRYCISEDGLEFSLDRFAGTLAGLELAEIEHEDDTVLRSLSDPLWTRRDISADPRYQGGHLAVHGIPAE